MLNIVSQPNTNTISVIVQAYQHYVSELGQEEPKLPGVSYNHKQLFFISFAQVSYYIRGVHLNSWCSDFVFNIICSSSCGGTWI